MFGAINEKHGGFGIVFLTEFVEKEFDETDRSGGKKFDGVIRSSADLGR